MERPRRAAAERAKELIARGWNVRRVQQMDVAGLSEDEEDRIDREIRGDDGYYEEIRAPEDDPVVDQGRGSGHASELNVRFKTYDDVDICPVVPAFKPCRPPGPYLENVVTRSESSTFNSALDFFKLFFTDELIQMLCDNTNIYGQLHVLDKVTYANAEGMWEDVTSDEMYRFIAMVLYMGLVKLPDLPRYYSQATLYSGGWARRFLPRRRLKAIMGMLHVSDPGMESRDDKLTKVRPLVEYIKGCCMKYYQPCMNLAIDERMVRTKGRTPITQFMPNKPARFGVKFWCLCDSSNGYTVDFNVYTGKRKTPGTHGLAYDVAMDLLANYKNQWYHVFCDNFFTSMALVSSLKDIGLLMCGTTLITRRGFPSELKDKEWAKKAKRGEMRFIRKDSILCLQWQDNKPVCICSSIHSGTEYVMAQRRGKDKEGKYQKITTKKPVSINDYNANMGGVDLSDQLLQTYNILLKSHRWWKTIFYHLIDVSTVNSFLLFKLWRIAHPHADGLRRIRCYSHLNFREELIRQLAGIEDDEDTPEGRFFSRSTPASVYHSTHIPVNAGTRRNCRVCYIRYQKEVKSIWKCANPVCDVHLCHTAQRNCCEIWHSPAFDGERSRPYTVVHI